MTAPAFPKPVKVERPRKPLRRKTWMRPKPPRRLRTPRSNPAYLEFVRGLPCCVRSVRCAGPIHAHHAGRKPGIAMKADDDTAIPLCAVHHRDWHDNQGPFFTLSKLERFAWSLVRIGEVRALYAEEGRGR